MTDSLFSVAKFLARRILLPIVLGLLGAAALRSETLRLEVASDRVTAGDLAPLVPPFQQADPAAVVGYAPLPGVERRVTERELRDWAADLSLQPAAGSLPETLIIARRMRRLAGEEVRRVVTAAVAERYQLDASQVDVEFHGFAEPLIPAEPLEFTLASKLTDPGRPVTLTLRWTNREGRSGNLSFRATVRVHGSYAVAREALAARSEVTAADFEFREGVLPGPPDQYLASSDDIAGNSLRLNMKAGEALEKRLLVSAPTVKRGELIELQLRSRSVVLRTSGRAEESGSTGDVIRCRNLQSGNTVRAIVTDSRQAEVVR